MHDPTTPPNTPTAPQADLTAPPGTALQIAQMLAAGTIDTAQAGKLAKAGNLSTLAVAQALNALPAAPAAQAPIAPTAPAPTAPPPRAPGPPGAPISPAQAEIMIGWEKDNLAQGRITLEEANKRFDSLGATPEQRAPDSRTAKQIEADAAYPVARPHEFVIRYYTPGQEPPVMPKEVKEFDTNARAWLSQGAGLPRELGNSLVSAISKVIERTHGMTEAQLEQRGYDEFDKLTRVHGDQLNDKLKSVDRMVHAIEATHPGLYRFLMSHGIADDSMVMNTLMNYAPIFWAKRGKS